MYQQLIKPKNKWQEEYIRTISENEIIFCCGPSGSGKTAISIGLACEKFHNNEIKRIIFTRPFVNTGKGMGWLAGNKEDKTQPYFLPAMDEFEKYFSRKELADLRKDKKIIIEPLEFMRGSNFYDSFMIMTEAQNATYEQIRMFGTRLGNGSKCIFEGDTKQCDLMNCDYFKFVDLFSKKDVHNISTIELPHESIVRSKIISSFIMNTDNFWEET